MSNKQYFYALKNGGKYWCEEGMGEYVPDLGGASLYPDPAEWDAQEGDEIVTIEAILKDIGKTKKKLTAEEIDLYIANGGAKCPYCRGEDIESDDIEHYHDKSTVLTRCVNCEKAWLEKYKLVWLEEIDEGAANTI